jgi:hypothetical protein
VRLIADYTIGVFIVLAQLLLIGLRERRERAKLPRASGE